MKKWGVGARVLLGVFALPGCGDECSFSLAIAEPTATLFVGRDCGLDDTSFTRHALGAPEADPFKISPMGYARLSLDREERRLAGISPLGTIDFYTTQASVFLGSSDRLPAFAGEAVFTPDASSIWVSLWGRYSGVGLVDLKYGMTRATIPFPGEPVSVVFSESDNTILVAPTDPGKLRKLHSAQFIEIATASTSGALDLVLLPDARVAVLEDSANRLVVRDLETLAEQSTLSVGAEARQVETSKDGKWMAVTERSGRQLRIFDAPSLTEHALVTLEGEPEALALSNDGRAFVAFTDRDQVIIIDLETAAVTGEVQL